MNMIRLTIDNQEVTTQKGLTILEAAKNAGIHHSNALLS